MPKLAKKHATKTVAARAVTTQPSQPTQSNVVERSKGRGRATLKASSRGRDASFADRHDHSSRDEGDRLAAALCPRLLRGRGAKEASAQTQFEEDRRQSNLPHRRR